MKKHLLVKYLVASLLTLVLAPSAIVAYGSQAPARTALDASLAALAQGHDLSLINAWRAKAQTIRDGETYSTSFNSSCGALVYGYRASEKSLLQSNDDTGPEFPPHIAAVVLFAEAHDPDSVISSAGLFAENGKVYNAISIRPGYHGNRDAAYAPEQIWYFDQATNLPKRVRFSGKGIDKILFLDDFRPSGDGWLTPYSASYSPGKPDQAAYHYSEIALWHEQCP